MTIIRQYQNGNCTVTLHDDGTKMREWEGTPRPKFPESVDLKITDQCDMGCAHCSEASYPDGRHADGAELLRLTEGLPPGVEVALGGGDPLANPQLARIAASLSDRGLIVNLTCHTLHAVRRHGLLKTMRGAAIIHGLGLSGCDSAGFTNAMCPGLVGENTVLHFVAGVDDPWKVVQAEHHKILILGYKRRGRGAEIDAGRIREIQHNQAAWRYWLPKILAQTDVTVCFDNLALGQLKVQTMVSPKTWRAHYMGDDGQFSLFVDAVRGQFATSSAEAKRHPLGDKTIFEAFDRTM